MAAMKRVTRGAFIVIEGLDRSGKSTQVERAKSELLSRGVKVKLLRFPDRSTTIGEMINKYLQSKSNLEDHVIHLLFSANRWELSNQIDKDVAEGYTIICDRYYYSGMIYSAAKSNPALTLEWARQPEVGLPRPDLVIFLDLKIEDAEKRGGYGDEKYEKRELQEKVKGLFHSLREAAEEEADDMVFLDAGGSVEDVGSAILGVVEKRLSLVQKGEYGEKIRTVGPWKER